MSKPQNKRLADQLSETLIDLSLAIRLMPACGMSTEEAWRMAVSYYGGFMAKELFHLGLIDREHGGRILEALGLDGKDATGGDGKKGWRDEPSLRRRK